MLATHITIQYYHFNTYLAKSEKRMVSCCQFVCQCPFKTFR